jgi:hypothetical protein
MSLYVSISHHGNLPTTTGYILNFLKVHDNSTPTTKSQTSNKDNLLICSVYNGNVLA